MKFKFSVKTGVWFLIGWLLLGYVGRSMMKYYDVKTYESTLRQVAWTRGNEIRYNQLILTGPGSYWYSILFIAVQDEPKWGMILDFKVEKIPTWQEVQELRKKKDLKKFKKSNKLGLSII